MAVPCFFHVRCLNEKKTDDDNDDYGDVDDMNESTSFQFRRGKKLCSLF